MATKSLILAPRQVILDCRAVLQNEPGWLRKPLRAHIRLIYCLNDIWDRHGLTRYHRGPPVPSKTLRELEGLGGRCRTAAQTGNTAPVVKRVLDLMHSDRDSFHLIRYSVARELRPDRPEAVVSDPDTTSKVEEIAETDPSHLGAICDELAARIAIHKGTGRGGARRQDDLRDRFVLESLGYYFEWLTGRRPAATFRGTPLRGEDDVRSKDRYDGPFIRLCQAVLGALGAEVSSRQVADLLRSLDVPGWETPERFRVPWDPKKRRKQSPQ